MIGRRSLLVLAVVAALLGAPSTVFAARNVLSQPAVTPAGGPAGTVFTFRVSYEGFAATSVTASAAGMTIPLALVSGSVTDGTWSGSTTLPVGSWPTSFMAVAARGNAPSVAGPRVIVRAPSTSKPARPTPTIAVEAPTGPETTDPMSGAGDPDPTAVPAPAEASPVAASSEAAPVEPSAAPAGASGDPETVAGDAAGGSLPTGGGNGAPAEDTDAGAPQPASPGDATGDPSPAVAPPAAPVAPASLEPDHDELGAGRDDLLSLVLTVGLSGVGVVALVGLALLLIARRRDDDERRPAEATADAMDGATRTRKILERRTLRRAHLKLDDDPIVAALVRDDEGTPRSRRRAGQVNHGPGERPHPRD